MLEFVHFKVKTIEHLYDDFNEVQRLFASRSYDFDSRLEQFLSELLKYFTEQGNSSKESHVLEIINRISSIKKGFNPIKLEKITTGKREFYWGNAFSSLEQIRQMLEEIYSKEKNKLEEGEELLRNLIVSLYQNNMLNDTELNSLDSVAKIEAFWTSLLSQNGTISALNKKLRMNLLPEDIYLLMEKIISEIQ